MGMLVAALVERAAQRGRAGTPVFIDDDTLVAAGVVPWTGLPLWIPRSDASAAGFLEFDCRRAHDHGLALRPLMATIDDTARWLCERDNTGAWQQVLAAGPERALVQAFRGRGAGGAG
jgi:2'-hydroxyisoflavone reductase